MKPCLMAGAQCPHAAVRTVRIDGVGDRDLCADHTRIVTEELGFGRVLEADAYVPEWRKRSLLRDQTAITGPVV
jgi:hypothetical protein